MRFNIRWQLLLAVLSMGLVLSLLSFQVQTAGLCSVTVPAAGGTYVEGMMGKPRYLNPLLSDGYPVDEELVSLIFDGLTRYDESGELVPALAQSWTVSDDGLSVRFTLRQDVTWHDGEPFTAADVAFTYGLYQDENFPGLATLGTLWQAITINQISATQIEFVLPEPYAPFLDVTTRGILPAHRLEGITGANLADSAFNQSPTGTGPFMISSDQNWQRTQRLRLTPNPLHWRQGTKISNLEFRFFPDEITLEEAFEAGEIQAINSVTYTQLPHIAAIPGVRLSTAESARYTSLIFNLSDSGSPALKSVAARQALAYALDRQALIDEVLNGQGLLLEGPYLPSSWAYHPQMLTPYAHQPVSATINLESEGWLLPEGESIRQQEGELLELTLVALDTPLQREVATAVAGQWEQVGVMVDLLLYPDVGELRSALANREYDVALAEIKPPGDPDLYDFWSQEALVRGQNYSGWNHQRASEALERGRKAWGMDERRAFYDIFQRYYDNNLPALTLFQHVYTYAMSGDVNEAEIGRISHPRDRYESMANWFLFYRDVTVGCPEDSA